MKDELMAKCAGCGKKCEMWVPGPSVCKQCREIIARVNVASERVKLTYWLCAGDNRFLDWAGFEREEGMNDQLIATIKGWA